LYNTFYNKFTKTKMTNVNVISLAKSSSKITKLAQNVSKTCNSLVEMFEKFMDAVSTYGVWTVQKLSNLVNSLLVDRMMNKIFRLKNYIKEIHTAVKEWKITEEESHEIIPSLMESSNSLTKKMQESTFFYNNFGYLVNEVIAMINHTLNVMPVYATK